MLKIKNFFAKIYKGVKSFFASILEWLTTPKAKAIGKIIVAIVVGYWVFFVYQTEKRPLVVVKPKRVEAISFGKVGHTVKFEIEIKNKGASPSTNTRLYHSFLSWEIGEDKKIHWKLIDPAYTDLPDLPEGDTSNFVFEKYIPRKDFVDPINFPGYIAVVIFMQWKGSTWVFWKTYQTVELYKIVPFLQEGKMIFEVKGSKGPKFSEVLFTSNPNNEFKRQMLKLMKGTSLEDFLELDRLKRKGNYSLR